MRAAHSTSSAPGAVLGSTLPRLWTPSLRELTPLTSYGYDVVDFARDVLGTPLDPWQAWLVVHLGELLPDGRPRFRTVLAFVARQQGKTYLLRVLTTFWMFLERRALTLSTSTTRDYALESWRAVVKIAQENRLLAAEIGQIRLTTGTETITTTSGASYKIAAANRRGGRSLSIDRLIVDELREHQSWDAWNATTNAQNAIFEAQTVAISNMGDDNSIVLDTLRGAALSFLETGEGDYRLGIFEWSAPDGSDPCSLEALACANPQLGRRTDADALLGPGMRAKAAGGEELAGYMTEVMCMRVRQLNAAIEPSSWSACATDTPIDLADYRDRVALCVDVSLDGSHASLIAAALIDGKVHAEVIEAWHGFGCTKILREELPDIVRKIKPRSIGWFPAGPAASVAADLTARRRTTWPPRGVIVEEIRGDTVAVAMGLAEQVAAGQLVHPGDPMLDAHVLAASKLHRGDGWVFGRRGTGPIDGTYALAGAVHLARTLPAPRPPLVAL